jgi:hypothetical protein
MSPEELCGCFYCWNRVLHKMFGSRICHFVGYTIKLRCANTY